MKIHAIINPLAAGKAFGEIENTLYRILGGHLRAVDKSTYRGDATYIARQAVNDGADVVIAVGGDGTVCEVCNGIIGHDVSLGIIPIGTANDLAAALGISSDIEAACSAILARDYRTIDAIRVNGRYYLTTGGLGMSGHALAAAEFIRHSIPSGVRLGRAIGDRLYLIGLLCALLNLRNWHHRVTVSTEGQSWEADAFSLTVGNLATLGGRFQLAPGAASDDGLIDVCVLNNYRSLAAMLQTVVRTMSGTHVELDTVNTLRCSRLQVDCPTPQTWFADGEVVCTDTRFVIEVVPRAIRVLAPLSEDEVSDVA